jgi:hypothetical protein
MRRCFRILFNAATLLSFGLLLGTVVLWVRSYWVGELFTYQPARRGDLFFGLSRGEIAFCKDGHGHYIFDPYCEGFWHRPTGPEDLDGGRTTSTLAYFRCRGFACKVEEVPTFGLNDGPGPIVQLQARTYFLPLWFVAGVFGMMPCVWFLRKRSRPHGGCCSRCGYGLRATPDRCPECGKVPNVASTMSPR